MRGLGSAILVAAVLSAVAPPAASGGPVSGRTSEKKADGDYGPPVPKAEITFTRVGGPRKVVTVQSDFAGRYQTDLETGHYRIRVRHAEYDEYDHGGSPVFVTAGPRRMLDFRLTRKTRPAGTPPPGGFAGTVWARGVSGGVVEVEGAEVIFEGDDGSRAAARTGKDGRYRLPLDEGQYRVRATHPTHGQYASSPHKFAVHGKGMQTGNLFLHPPAE